MNECMYAKHVIVLHHTSDALFSPVRKF